MMPRGITLRPRQYRGGILHQRPPAAKVQFVDTLRAHPWPSFANDPIRTRDFVQGRSARRHVVSERAVATISDVRADLRGSPVAMTSSVLLTSRPGGNAAAILIAGFCATRRRNSPVSQMSDYSGLSNSCSEWSQQTSDFHRQRLQRKPQLFSRKDFARRNES